MADPLVQPTGEPVSDAVLSVFSFVYFLVGGVAGIVIISAIFRMWIFRKLFKELKALKQDIQRLEKKIERRKRK